MIRVSLVVTKLLVDQGPRREVNYRLEEDHWVGAYYHPVACDEGNSAGRCQISIYDFF